MDKEPIALSMMFTNKLMTMISTQQVTAVINISSQAVYGQTQNLFGKKMIKSYQKLLMHKVNGQVN